MSPPCGGVQFLSFARRGLFRRGDFVEGRGRIRACAPPCYLPAGGGVDRTGEDLGCPDMLNL
jgi:hypothetical protein